MFIINGIIILAIVVFCLGLLGMWQAMREGERSSGTSGAMGLFTLFFFISAVSGGVGTLFSIIKIFLTNSW